MLGKDESCVALGCFALRCFVVYRRSSVSLRNQPRLCDGRSVTSASAFRTGDAPFRRVSERADGRTGGTAWRTRLVAQCISGAEASVQFACARFFLSPRRLHYNTQIGNIGNATWVRLPARSSLTPRRPPPRPRAAAWLPETPCPFPFRPSRAPPSPSTPVPSVHCDVRSLAVAFE